MHRVELKDEKALLIYNMEIPPVPNAPCGVERRMWWKSFMRWLSRVPNAPCGVESGYQLRDYLPHSLHPVPNAPCRVESVKLKD